MPKIQQACFGAGCFWGVEYYLGRKMLNKGVLKHKVGYAMGKVPNPTYEIVCRKDSGHNEVVWLEYDEDKISYQELLKVFWDIHDPTQVNRQGVDVGTNYRSGIYYYTEDQRKIAEKSKEEQQKKESKPIATEILKMDTFWPAETYHQDYFHKKEVNGERFHVCHFSRSGTNY